MRDPGRRPCAEEIEILRAISRGENPARAKDVDPCIGADLAWLSYYGFIDIYAPSDWDKFDWACRGVSFKIKERGIKAIEAADAKETSDV